MSTNPLAYLATHRSAALATGGGLVALLALVSRHRKGASKPAAGGGNAATPAVYRNQVPSYNSGGADQTNALLAIDTRLAGIGVTLNALDPAKHQDTQPKQFTPPTRDTPPGKPFPVRRIYDPMPPGSTPPGTAFPVRKIFDIGPNPLPWRSKLIDDSVQDIVESTWTTRQAAYADQYGLHGLTMPLPAQSDSVTAGILRTPRANWTERQLRYMTLHDLPGA